VLAALSPYWSAAVQARAAALPSATARLPPIAAHGWQGPEEAAPTWAPVDPAEPGLRGRYSGAAGTVDVEIVTAARAHGAEVVGYLGRRLEASRAQVLELPHAVETGGATVMETVLRTRGAEIVLWHWYRIGAAHTAEDWHAKALEAWGKLARGDGDAALVVLAARSTDREAARETLRKFAADAFGAIDACLSSDLSECADAR
jgi:EpsI family protein